MIISIRLPHHLGCQLKIHFAMMGLKGYSTNPFKKSDQIIVLLEGFSKLIRIHTWIIVQKVSMNYWFNDSDQNNSSDFSHTSK